MGGIGGTTAAIREKGTVKVIAFGKTIYESREIFGAVPPQNYMSDKVETYKSGGRPDLSTELQSVLKKIG